MSLLGIVYSIDGRKASGNVFVDFSEAIGYVLIQSGKVGSRFVDPFILGSIGTFAVCNFLSNLLVESFVCCFYISFIGFLLPQRCDRSRCIICLNLKFFVSRFTGCCFVGNRLFKSRLICFLIESCIQSRKVGAYAVRRFDY